MYAILALLAQSRLCNSLARHVLLFGGYHRCSCGCPCSSQLLSYCCLCSRLGDGMFTGLHRVLLPRGELVLHRGKGCSGGLQICLQRSLRRSISALPFLLRQPLLNGKGTVCLLYTSPSPRDS